MKKTKIGGQALLEGVMMQGSCSMAVAVRDTEGAIRIKTERQEKRKNIFYKIPVVRGVFYFVRSLVTGTRVLTDSARVFMEEEGKAAKKSGGMGIMLFVSVALALALSIGLFILLPNIIVNLLTNLFAWELTPFVKNLIEGGVKLLIFVGYIVFVGFLKDIRRVFMYHGAEHRTINAYEKGLPLTVENVQAQTTFHPRCGTSFMFFVLFISILVFSLLGRVDDNVWLRLGLRLAVLPLVAGISYEFLKLLALSDNKLLFPFKAPGYLLQKLSTRKPEDSMAEVAIAAFKKVVELDENPDAPTEDFVLPRTLDEVRNQMNREYEARGIEKGGDIDWILCHVLALKSTELRGGAIVKAGQQDRIKEIIDRRAAGEPLQYILGYTEFFGLRIRVTPDVLIPRPETELLAEEAIKRAAEGQLVLDLCTGSGAVAAAIAKNSSARVFASDISASALKVAAENAENNGVSVNFVESDLFDAVQEKFDIIVCNPPYIKTSELESLQKEVRFEPSLALDGGADGIEFYRRIISGARQHLTEGGSLLLEVGIGQAEQIAELLGAEGFCDIEVKKDLENINRIVTAKC